MLPLRLDSTDAPLRLVALAAHPDDLEIGCGGTLLQLTMTVPRLSAELVVATGSPERCAEVRHAAELFLPGRDVRLHLGGLPDGRLPAHWEDVKDLLEHTAAGRTADLVLAPTPTDAHQDHRLLAQLAPTVWRDQLVLGYEIPKWDGDLGNPQLYVPLDDEVMRTKVELLNKAYPSQSGRDWFDDEVFYGLARIRGMECRSRYAEAFTITKARLTW
ncbi:MAG: PIG-L family deacetylase [Streptosporangiales bacterium]|nr:PIG-L family deacetylase [Streptosporangiales bacterium]